MLKWLKKVMNASDNTNICQADGLPGVFGETFQALLGVLFGFRPLSIATFLHVDSFR